VSFGYKDLLPDQVSCTGTSYELEEPIKLAGRWQPYFGVKSSVCDPSLNPEGTSVVTTGGPTDWSYWQPLVGDRQAYDSAKQQLAESCRQQIEQRYLGFSSKVEVTDVATPPHTFNRYTGNWQGVYMTWDLSTEFHRRHPQRYLPGRFRRQQLAAGRGRCPVVQLHVYPSLAQISERRS
jgi:phytoene dehydrogenase-like protein